MKQSTLRKVAQRLRSTFGEIRPDIASTPGAGGISNLMPGFVQSNPLLSIPASFLPYMLYQKIPGIGHLARMPQNIVNSRYQRLVNALPGHGTVGTAELASHLKSAPKFSRLSQIARRYGKASNIAGGITYGAVTAPLFAYLNYAINRPIIARHAAQTGAAMGARNPFIRWNKNYGGRKTASLGGDMEFSDIRERALAGAISLQQGMQKEAFNPRLGWKTYAALAAAAFAAQQLGRAYLIAESKITEKASRQRHWDALTARYPEFLKDPRYEILYEDIHKLSPSLASIPSTASVLLRNAVDYGIDGLDINTAKALVDIQSKDPSAVSTSMRMEPMNISPVLMGAVNEEKLMQEPDTFKAILGERPGLEWSGRY